MITEVCQEVKNWFALDEGKRVGNYSIKDGTFAPLDFLKEGQYFRVRGSVFNDGVYQYPAAGLTDEDFSGEIWAMDVPPSFLALVAEIETYSTSDAASISPYASESWGGYSYSMATNSAGRADNSWKTVFASRLNNWRKI